MVSFFDLTIPQIYKYSFVEILPNIYLASNFEIYICWTPASGPKVTEPLPKGLLAALSKPLPLKQKHKSWSGGIYTDMIFVKNITRQKFYKQITHKCVNCDKGKFATISCIHTSWIYASWIHLSWIHNGYIIAIEVENEV